MHSLWNHQQLQECPDYGRESYARNLLESPARGQNDDCSNPHPGKPDVSIEKVQRDASVSGSTFTASPITVNIGDVIEYRLTVKNPNHSTLTVNSLGRCS